MRKIYKIDLQREAEARKNETIGQKFNRLVTKITFILLVLGAFGSGMFYQGMQLAQADTQEVVQVIKPGK